MIAPLFKWNHSDNHTVPVYDPFTRCDKRNIIISLSDPKYDFMKGHMIDGQLCLEAFRELFKLTFLSLIRSRPATCNWLLMACLGNLRYDAGS